MFKDAGRSCFKWIARGIERIIFGVFSECLSYTDEMVCHLPGKSGQLFRAAYLRFRLGTLGAKACIAPGFLAAGWRNIHIGSGFGCARGGCLLADGDGRIVLGNNVALNVGAHLNASIRGQITIGNDVMIGPNVMMRTSDHSTTRLDMPMRMQGHIAGAISVADDVWIGANVTILRDVSIGRGAIVAAGAVVTKDVPAFAVVSGVPARVLKWRDGRL